MREVILRHSEKETVFVDEVHFMNEYVTCINSHSGVPLVANSEGRLVSVITGECRVDTHLKSLMERGGVDGVVVTQSAKELCDILIARLSTYRDLL